MERTRATSPAPREQCVAVRLIRIWVLAWARRRRWRGSTCSFVWLRWGRVWLTELEELDVDLAMPAADIPASLVVWSVKQHVEAGPLDQVRCARVVHLFDGNISSLDTV